MPIRMLVVDDHPIVRYALINLLRAEPDFEIVGEAATCQECCDRVEALKPDVVLLDLEMDDTCGCQALTRLRAIHPAMRTIVYTAHDDERIVMDVMKLGIQGYVLKATSPEYIIKAIRAVNRGGSFLDPAMTGKVMDQVARASEERRCDERSLSKREATILTLIAQGRRNKEIARTLSITERTVKFHVSAVLSKLRASNRTEAVRIAAQRGLISLSFH